MTNWLTLGSIIDQMTTDCNYSSWIGTVSVHIKTQTKMIMLLSYNKVEDVIIEQLIYLEIL